MINKIFESKLLKEVFIIDIPKVKIDAAVELYLNKEIKITETSSTSLSFNVDGKVVNIKSDVGISYLVDNKKVKKDEYILACLLVFKRQYYINNDIVFDMKDFVVQNNYYNNTYVTFFNIDEYKLRIYFYIGVINELYNLDMKKECLSYMVELFDVLYRKLTFENKYLDMLYMFKFQVIKNKQQFIMDNYDTIINIFKTKHTDSLVLGDFVYTTVVNYPDILQHQNSIKIYDYIIKNYDKYNSRSQRYVDLCLHKRICEWYLGKETKNVMLENISKHEVRYCFVKKMFEKEQYKEICDAINKTTFNIPNQEINYMITYAYYSCDNIAGAVNVFNRFNNITYDRYITYKEKFPLMFEGDYLDNIISYIVDHYSGDEVNRILKEEDNGKFELIKLAKLNFNLIDDNIDKYIGKYDDLLIKLYQKEIENVCNRVRGRTFEIPGDLLKKFNILKRIKNGKYYIAEMVVFIKDNYFIMYSDKLDKYLKSLGV